MNARVCMHAHGCAWMRVRACMHAHGCMRCALRVCMQTVRCPCRPECSLPGAAVQSISHKQAHNTTQQTACKARQFPTCAAASCNRPVAVRPAGGDWCTRVYCAACTAVALTGAALQRAVAPWLPEDVGVGWVHLRLAAALCKVQQQAKHRGELTVSLPWLWEGLVFRSASTSRGRGWVMVTLFWALDPWLLKQCCASLAGKCLADICCFQKLA
jgi:hypothetical protein